MSIGGKEIARNEQPQPLIVRLDCGCTTPATGGWLGVVPLQRLTMYCQNGHKWQHIKEAVCNRREGK